MDAPLSYYDVLHLTGTTYLVMGRVQRVYLCKTMTSSQMSEDNENNLLKGVSMKPGKDPLDLTVTIKQKGRVDPFDHSDLKPRFFVVSDRYLYE